MTKNRGLLISLVVALLVPLGVGIYGVSAASPSFTIKNVVTDQSVTIQMSDMPANRDFVVQMGEYDKNGVGTKIAQFFSGSGGSLLATFNIPSALKGRAMISIRIDSTTGGYSAYNTFWNDSKNGTWPGGTPPPSTPTSSGSTSTSTPALVTGTPVPGKESYSGIPTIFIKSVDAGKSVTVITNNFPKNYDFVVRMGKMWTLALGGIETKTFNSKNGGSFEMTFEIPAALKNDQRISIRMDSTSGGFYSFNWFWNVGTGVLAAPTAITPTTTSAAPTPTVSAKPQVNIPTFTISAVVKDKSVSIKTSNFPSNTDFKVLMGKMGTMGIGGVEVTTFNSGPGGSFEATYTIPPSLAGLKQISIRLQGNYYYAYNWFWNNTTN